MQPRGSTDADPAVSAAFSSRHRPSSTLLRPGPRGSSPGLPLTGPLRFRAGPTISWKRLGLARRGSDVLRTLHHARCRRIAFGHGRALRVDVLETRAVRAALDAGPWCRGWQRVGARLGVLARGLAHGLLRDRRLSWRRRWRARLVGDGLAGVTVHAPGRRWIAHRVGGTIDLLAQQAASVRLAFETLGAAAAGRLGWRSRSTAHGDGHDEGRGEATDCHGYRVAAVTADAYPRVVRCGDASHDRTWCSGARPRRVRLG